ncbi:hypothetical protein [Streptomyces cylindrosporus]|uniref:Secreted protein n=1 Tax=Streptomyces cylindrosporus TaxID=2927583 RepID=A0ABS9Y495_9ACTN|nr:hypothetical protein [Streptomyces cylindrosporus]MCI3272028.1 hypothetical protein [Streptomyces cylindrosporus]
MRQLLVAAAVFAALVPTAAPAAARPAAVPPGQVYFWPEPGQMGAGGAWAYTPPGYREADSRVKRHAYSFDSHAAVSVYAISYQGGGSCLYREIRPDDYDNDWTAWATKFDGVSDTTMGCEQG